MMEKDKQWGKGEKTMRDTLRTESFWGMHSVPQQSDDS